MFCVLALTGAGPNTNFTSGRARKSEPAQPKPPPAAETPQPALPAPVEPAPPAPVAPVPKPEFSAEPAAAPAAPGIPETVWIDDDLPPGAIAEGTWDWDNSNFAAGTRSHGHPSAKGVHSHGVSMEKPVTIPSGSMITQQVWLDPKDPPKGISLKFKLSTGEEVGVYWEGEEEVFKPDESQELWYYGPLPELDKWTTLEVLAEDLGLENGQITSVRFATFGGRVLWDRTVLTAAPPIEQPQDLLQGPVEFHPEIGKKPES